MAEKNSYKEGGVGDCSISSTIYVTKRRKIFTRWNNPNSPLSALANHAGPAPLGAEIHQKGQCLFMLYLSLGKVSIAFLGVRDHSLSRTAFPSRAASGSLHLPHHRYKTAEADWHRVCKGFPKQPVTPQAMQKIQIFM